MAYHWDGAFEVRLTTPLTFLPFRLITLFRNFKPDLDPEKSVWSCITAPCNTYCRLCYSFVVRHSVAQDAAVLQIIAKFRNVTSGFEMMLRVSCWRVISNAASFWSCNRPQRRPYKRSERCLKRPHRCLLQILQFMYWEWANCVVQWKLGSAKCFISCLHYHLQHCLHVAAEWPVSAVRVRYCNEGACYIHSNPSVDASVVTS